MTPVSFYFPYDCLFWPFFGTARVFFLKSSLGTPLSFSDTFGSFCCYRMNYKLQGVGSGAHVVRPQCSFQVLMFHVYACHQGPGLIEYLLFWNVLFNFLLPYLGLWAPSPVTPLAASVCLHPTPSSGPNSGARAPSWMSLPLPRPLIAAFSGFP